jgi:hypothetical protein
LYFKIIQDCLVFSSKFNKEVFKMKKKMFLILICIGISSHSFAGDPPAFEYLTYPDKIIAVTDGSNWSGTSMADQTVNGSGMNYETWEHWMNGNGEGMWLAYIPAKANEPSPIPGIEVDDFSAWVCYEFNAIYNIGTVWIWNFNQWSTLTGRCLKEVWIDYSEDGVTWSRLMNGEQDYFTLASAPGTGPIEHTDEIDFGGVPAKFVAITAKALPEGTYGDNTIGGLSEVLFGIDTDSMATLTAPADEVKGLDPASITLQWQAPVNGAASYDVYLAPEEPVFDSETLIAENYNGLSYTVSNLDFGVTYYWRIDSHSTSGTFASMVSNFMTTGEATEPVPADRAFDFAVDGSDNLSWQGGAPDGENLFYIVYFSSSKEPLAAETPSSEYKLGDYSSLQVSGTDIVTFLGGDLNKGTTYFWRVDAVIGGTVFRSDVWRFTTVMNEVPFQNWVDFDVCYGYASNAVDEEFMWDGEMVGRGPWVACNGYGLDTTTWQHHRGLGVAVGMYFGGKNNDFNPAEIPGSAWFEVEFDQAYELGVMWVWNYNHYGTTDGGMRFVTISYSLDGYTYETLMNGSEDYFEFGRANGQNPFPHTAEIDFGGVSAQYVLITAKDVDGNWGGTSWSFADLLFGIEGTMAPPIVDAGPDTWTRVDQPLTMSASVIVPEGAVLNSTWSIDSAPAGGDAQIIDPSNPNTEITFDAAGVYVMKLDANYTFDESTSETVSDYVSVEVLPADYTGLLGYWDFNGDLTDKSGSGNNGTASGSAVIVTDPEMGQVLQLSGGYVSIPGDDFDLSSKRNQITISAWVKPDPGSTAWSGIVSKGSGAWQLSINEDADDIALMVENSTAFDLNADISGNAGWYHVIAVFDGSGFTSYINGSPAAAMDADLDIADNGLDVFIGALPSNPSYDRFQGLIDEVRIYERELSSQELLALKHPYDLTNDGLVNAQDLPLFAAQWLGQYYLGDFADLSISWGFDKSEFDQYLD